MLIFLEGIIIGNRITTFEGYAIEEIIRLYNSVGFQRRNMDYLLRWLHALYKPTYLSCIDSAYKDQLALDKAKLTCFNTMIDDLSDNYKIRNKSLLEKAVRIPWNSVKPYENEYLEVIRKIWLDSKNCIKNYPRFEEFKDVFYFDLDQFFSTIRYGYLANTMHFDNPLETIAYSYHNMMAILFCDMDIMCSPSFDKRELNKLRPILHWVQDICHIGNILSTYPREIEEADFSSPIISIAINDGVLNEDDIIKKPDDALKSLKYIVPYFKGRAEENFEKINESLSVLETVDIADFSVKIRNVYNAFLERPHYWKGQRFTQKKKITKSVVPPSKMYKNMTLGWVRM